MDCYKSFNIDGKVVEAALDAIGLTANANAVPNDTLPMFRPSGLRLGTPAITTRGYKASDMSMIAEWMKRAIDNRKNPEVLSKIKAEVIKSARSHEIPSHR